MAGNTKGLYIFMSYRREDSADVSGRIYDRLAAYFGHEAVFKDVDDIPFGVDFKDHLNNVVTESAVELVVIGPDWLTVTGEGGRRRLDDPTDFVRIEVEAALKRGIPVVPLLVSGASMPKDHDLPGTMQKLAYRNGTPVRPDPDFHHDMDRLIAGLEQYVKPQRGAVRPSAEPPAAASKKATPPSSGERVLFERGGDRVSNLVARVGGKSYMISSIRAASTEELPPTKSQKQQALAPGTLFGFAVMVGVGLLLNNAGLDVSYNPGGVALYCALAILLPYALGFATRGLWLKPNYAVRIVDSTSEKQILVSKDRAHVSGIVSAINNARTQAL